MRLPLSPFPRLETRWRVALLCLYLVVVLPALLFFNVGLTPDALVFVFLGAALLVGRPALFVRDWGVFLLVVVLWQQTGPVASMVNLPLHRGDLIATDQAIAWPLLHGALPQVWLQQHLFHKGHWQWYDLVSWAVYALHFPEPLIVGFAIWLRTRVGFQRFSLAFLTLAAIAFVGYIVYPAVPPWLAFRRYHAIPPVHKIFSLFNDDVLLGQLGHHYQHVLNVNYNLTAAMPSLHAAFPVLSALYLRKTFGRWGLLMLVYAAMMWFAVVYMAEHWTIDVIVGIGCALAAYAIVEGMASLLGRRAARRERVSTESANATRTEAISALSQRAGPGR